MMNATKIEILGCLTDEEWRTSTEVAYECSLSLTNASELLRRYRSQGLVNRRRRYDVPRGFEYRITDVGFERLLYLCSGELETSQVLADATGLQGAKKRVFDRWVKQKLGGY